ncbi:MAG TPA: RdgB/HAM1 family non-canonical purine NTP pyrophosphatase [Elusimicrobiota bacterium]|nr:RdgB/HAM1 family non-canonical purine NTP pyrophosphatase [Elusimicrobiota bacterium]
MRRLFLATGNSHKVREISEALRGLGVALALPKDCPGFPEIDEDQPTIEGNARKKAQTAARFCGDWALADDTGLEVAALGGRPGVYSARYAGPGCDFAANIKKLLSELRGVPAPRRAVFRTVMALAGPDGAVICEEGRLEGEITIEPRGIEGFGYDPVFYAPDEKKTLAEMGLAEKNRISHRARALAAILPRVKQALALGGVLLCLGAPPSRALPTEQPPQTVWDQMMAAQSNQDISQGYDDFSNHHYATAAMRFSRAVAADPKNADAHMMLGAAYYWLGEVDESLKEYQISLKLNPNSAQLHILRGISLAYEDRDQEAYDAFRKAIKLDPNRPDSFMDLASLEESLGKISDALEHLRRAVALAPTEPLYRFQLGALYYLLGRSQDAEAAFRKSLDLNPQFEDAWLEMGAVQESDGDLKSALASFEKALELKNRDSVARLRLGRVLLFEGRFAQARKIFAGAFHLTPREGGAGLQLSVAYSGKSAASGGANAPSGAASGAAEPPAPSAGGAAMPKLSADDPLSVFARNLERIPLDQDAIMQVQAVFMPKPQLVEPSSQEVGSSQLKRALQMAVNGPSQGIQAVNRSYQIRAAGPEERRRQIAGILQDLQKTVAEAPDGSDVHLGMNLTFNKLQELSDGSRSADAQSGGGGAGSGENPSNSNVLYEPRQVGNDMGLWIVGVGWMALVQETLPQIGEPPNHPDQTDWWVAEGLARADLGQGRRALDAFKRAVSLDSQNESALLGLGVAYVITGDEKGAEETYRRVLRLDPKNREARQGLNWLLRPAAVQASPRGGGHGG